LFEFFDDFFVENFFEGSLKRFDEHFKGIGNSNGIDSIGLTDRFDEQLKRFGSFFDRISFELEFDRFIDDDETVFDR